jgi:quercetin dioxygenase-like cupin family protein
MSGPAQHLDLTAALRQLRGEPHLDTNGYRTVTLVHRDTLRVVLMAFDAGARMPEHDANGPVTLQVLRGRLRIGTPDGVIELVPGQLLALETGLSHDVEAVEESDLLLGVHPLDPYSPPSPVSDA